MPHLARIVLLLAFLVVARSARADISLPATVPPQVDAGSARVLRGGQVAIELRGHYGGAGSISFGISRPPRHGKLSGLQARSGNRVTVTYSHVAGHPEKSDDFAYIIQAGGRVSSPAEVRIEIDDPPPRLQTIGELEFGEIQAGQSALRDLPITNAGGAVLQGRITVSSPWRIAPADFRVEAGKTERVRVAFQPNEARAFVGQITLSDEAGNTTTVSMSGTADPALRVLPGTLLFGAEPRKETILLTNLTGAPVELTFETSRHLQPIEALTLAAEASQEVAVEVSAETVGPVHETMNVAGPHFRVPVVIEIPALLPPPTVATAAPSVPPPVAAQPAPSVAPVFVAPAVSQGAEATTAPGAVPMVKVTAHRIAPALWELRWPAGAQRAASYRIEERSLSLDSTDTLQTAWLPLKAKVDPAGDPVIAKVGDLHAHRLHVLRVTALDADGTPRWESPPIALAAAPVSSHERALWLTGLSLALAAFLFLRWRAR